MYDIYCRLYMTCELITYCRNAGVYQNLKGGKEEGGREGKIVSRKGSSGSL